MMNKIVDIGFNITLYILHLHLISLLVVFSWKVSVLEGLLSFSVDTDNVEPGSFVRLHISMRRTGLW